MSVVYTFGWNNLPLTDKYRYGCATLQVSGHLLFRNDLVEELC